MHRLGDIGAAVVDQHPAGMGHALGAQPGVGGDRLGALGERLVGELEVDEAGAGDLHRRQPGVAGQPLRHRGRDLARVLAHALGRGEGAVGLEVGEVGAIGRGDAAQFGRQAKLGEGGLDRFA